MKYLLFILIALSFSELANSASFSESCPYGHRSVSTVSWYGNENDSSGCLNFNRPDSVRGECYFEASQWFIPYVTESNCAKTPSDDTHSDGCYPGEADGATGYCNDTQECYSPTGGSYNVGSLKSCEDYCTGGSKSVDPATGLVEPTEGSTGTGSVHACGTNPSGYDGDRLGSTDPTSTDTDDTGDTGTGDTGTGDTGTGDTGTGDTGTGDTGTGDTGTGDTGTDLVYDENNHPIGDDGCPVGYLANDVGGCSRDQSCGVGEYNTGSGCDAIQCGDGSYASTSSGLCGSLVGGGDSTGDTSDPVDGGDTGTGDTGTGDTGTGDTDTGDTGTGDTDTGDTGTGTGDTGTGTGSTGTDTDTGGSTDTGTGTTPIGTDNGSDDGTGTGDGDGNSTGSGDEGDGTGSGDSGTGTGDSDSDGDCDPQDSDYLECLEFSYSPDKFDLQGYANSSAAEYAAAKERYKAKLQEAIANIKDKLTVTSPGGNPFFNDSQDVFGVPVDFGTARFQPVFEYLPALILFMASVSSALIILGGGRK